jgi:septal ring factor EnvC (AmiA/AmiB activator)
MANIPQPIDNTAQDTPVELLELIRAIDALPPQQRLTLQPALNRVVESSARRRKILSMVQEALGQLRLDMKYLVFDLEATRRERDRFEQQIKDLTDENPME